jgi:hypothetical protein
MLYAYAINNNEGFDFSHIVSMNGHADQLIDCIMLYPTFNTHIHFVRYENNVKYELIIKEENDNWSVHYISKGNYLDLDQLFWSMGGHNPMLYQTKCIIDGVEQVLLHTS